MAMYYHIIKRIIERIGDHPVRIAENAQPILDVDLDPKIMTALKEANVLSMAIFDKSIISFFNADIKEAHKTIESVATLEHVCGDISNMAFKQETVAAISINDVAESIRRAGEYSADISENVINYIVEEDRSSTGGLQGNKIPACSRNYFYYSYKNGCRHSRFVHFLLFIIGAERTAPVTPFRAWLDMDCYVCPGIFHEQIRSR